MDAVHFGAGNIGRGFIGSLLYQSKYHTTFVDVNEDVIQALNEQQAYQVTLASENNQTVMVKDVSGINSVEEPETVVEAIAKADIVTTAVGPSILPAISELIAKGLQKRLETNSKPLNVIACENMVGGSSQLKEKVMEHVTEDEAAAFTSLFGFPDAAVDRIVPNQANQDLLEVSVEPYYEWIVEETAIKGNKPAINGITYVSDLRPYIERKLFTVNTGHAAAAYVGNYLGYKTIHEAMNDVDVQGIIKGALSESGKALVQTYHFDREEHQVYIDKIVQRFKNPHISDDVTRVGRGPLRKLGPKDRLIRPATMYTEVTGRDPVYLAEVIAAALEYRQEDDEEAVQLQQMIADKGYEQTLQQVCGLGADHPLTSVVLRQLERLKELKKD